MIQTPAQYNAQRARGAESYPLEDLSRYRFHTGARLRPLAPDEPCPVLYRDVGFEAMATYLRGGLTRLAGPFTPITYMRTEAYVEPYTDYEQIGRLIFVQPLELQPWYSGVEHIYVARAHHITGQMGYVPGELSLDEATRLAQDVEHPGQLREAFGGRIYDQCLRDSLARLERLQAEFERSELRAQPLRRLLQSGQSDEKKRAWEWMDRLGIDEGQLCSAWHHLPRASREALDDALLRLPPGLCPDPRARRGEA